MRCVASLVVLSIIVIIEPSSANIIARYTLISEKRHAYGAFFQPNGVLCLFLTSNGFRYIIKYLEEGTLNTTLGYNAHDECTVVKTIGRLVTQVIILSVIDVSSFPS